MKPAIPKIHLSAIVGAAVGIALASPCWAAQVAPAEDQAVPAETQKAVPAGNPSDLRICAAANEEPFSSSKNPGFENRIAAAVAEAMGRTAQFVWHERPGIYLVRDQLDTKACDIVMGIDTGDERVLTTKPYFRAPYVFVQRQNSPLDIKSWDSPDILKAGKIGFDQDTPAQIMLQDLHLYGANFNYMKSLTDFKSRRNQYVRIEPTRMVGEVANGTADIAIVFAPEVARYVKEKASELKMTVIPKTFKRSDGVEVTFHYDQAIGVRKDDVKLRDEIDAALDKARSRIEAILKDEGIPLVQAGMPEGRAG
jgi:mxaJ protein